MSEVVVWGELLTGSYEELIIFWGDTLDDCYGAVQKPKYISSTMAWNCHTQSNCTPATIFFLPSTVISRSLKAVIENTNKFSTQSKPILGSLSSSPLNLSSD
ncbi:hypothetical protein T265_07762 [Opisthorchis viverrini]|uniref:Uncharacterized protein n=1 Tax=Opisthorchis viverrini TaxID=6198 RepID=A0A075AAN2_OPIVI|nr:hypothetical protein T265_07762 [Opisthorchis viverrini]KER24619.1 hypothetical protein T265_07762 [Opisthorchis viverrini]